MSAGPNLAAIALSIWGFQEPSMPFRMPAKK